MMVGAHDVVRTRLCATAGCVEEAVDLEHGLCDACGRARRVSETEITLEVFRDRGRCWIRALHLPSRRRTRWRELKEWSESVKSELVAELRGVLGGV